MYNQEFKERYLDDNEYRSVNMRKYMMVQFEKTQSYEEMLGKDLYDFSVREILDYYTLLFSPSLETIMVLNNQLVSYARYALNNHLIKDCQNHFEEIDNDAIIKCINKGLFNLNIFTREQILTLAGNMQNPCEGFVLLAFFEGICGVQFSDIANLTMDNFRDGKVYLPSGKVFEVSDELIRMAEESANEMTYYSYCMDGTIKEKLYKEGDKKIIKEMANTYATGAMRDRVRVYNRLAKISDVYGLPGVTSKALMESGRIEMIRGFMLQDQEYDIAEVYKKHKDEIVYRYGKIPSIPRYEIKYGEFYK